MAYREERHKIAMYHNEYISMAKITQSHIEALPGLVTTATQSRLSDIHGGGFT
jgi:hypothetical protein